MFCRNCGQKFADDSAVFCPNCGVQNNEQNGKNVQMAKQSEHPYQEVYQAPQFAPPLSTTAPKKRRGGCLKYFLIFVVLVAGTAFAAYFLVSGLFKPHDLGVKTSKQAYESAVQKLGYTKDKAPTEGTAEDYKYTYGTPKAVNVSLTSEEITSFLNENRPPYYAIKNVQVRINPDNTVEAAASLDVAYLFNYILDGKYNRNDAQNALPMLGLLPDKINVYSKFSGGIRNNKVEKMSVEKVSVMGIPIPETLVSSSEAKSFVNSSLNNYLGKESAKQKSTCELLEVDNGNVNFKGKIPSSITRTPVR